MRHRPIALDPADVQIKIRGGVRPGDVRRARQTVAELSRLAHEPVLGAKAAAPARWSTAGRTARTAWSPPCTDPGQQ